MHFGESDDVSVLSRQQQEHITPSSSDDYDGLQAHSAEGAGCHTFLEIYKHITANVSAPEPRKKYTTHVLITIC